MADVLRQVQKVHIHVTASAIVPDKVDQIQAVVKQWADDDCVDLVLTSDGTGFSPRDVTPQAIKDILHKEIPGFVIAMFESSLKITAKAMLARPVADIRHTYSHTAGQAQSCDREFLDGDEARSVVSLHSKGLQSMGWRTKAPAISVDQN